MAFQMLAPAPGALAQEASAFASVLPAASQSADVAADSSQGAEGDGAAGGETSAGDTGEGATGSTEEPNEGAQDDAADAGVENPSESGPANAPSADDEAANEEAPAEKAADESNSEDESADTQAVGDYAITTVAGLKSALGDGNVELGADGKATKITVDVQNDKLLALSNTDPALYQHATIKRGTGTGAGFDVTGEVTIGSAKYGFKGFGSDAFPFEGSFELGDETIALDKSLFNNVKLSKDRALKLIWKGIGSQPIVANKIDGNAHTLTANVTVAGKVNTTDSAATLTSPLMADVSGPLGLSATYAVEASSFAVSMNAATGNIGLLANTVEASSSLDIANVSGLPETYNGNPSIKTESGNAGGLIGECGKGATVNVGCGIDLSKFKVAGSNASGGIIGAATNLTLSFADDASAKPAQKVGSANGVYAGGLIGSVSFAGAYSVDSAKFGFGDNAPTIELGASKRAGGLFGRLDVSNGDVTVQGGMYKSKLAVGQDSDSNRGSYGGIAGNVCSTDSKAIHALNVGKKGDAAAQIEIERAASLCYVGGIAGYQGDAAANQKVAVVLDGVQVQINGAAYAYAGNGKLGGAVGVVDVNNVLDVRDFKLKSTSPIGAQNGGSAGIAGSAWRGVIKFSGTTDLSDAKFADSDYAAQLVYQNYNALIFATGSGSDDGWTFKRPNAAVKIDDIYSYGEVIRLGNGLSGDLIQLNADTHVLTLGTSLQKTNDTYVLNNVDDFAKLAITWQTFGYFSMVDGVGGGSVASLACSTINVAGTIDLADTGLTGLSKDRECPDNNEGKNENRTEDETAHYFSGTLTGDGAINLAVGEPYGKRGDSAIDSDDTSDGNGKIYRHARLGLFDGIAGTATVSNVTVGGTMRFDNRNNVDAGALAATFGGASLAASGAHFTTAITYDNTAGDKALNVGGILGSVSGAGTVSFGKSTEGQSTETAATIASRVQDRSNPRVGGAIGFVGGDSTATINAAGLAVSGSISIPNFTGQALAGGFIGYIQQGSSLKTVNITGLSLGGFSLSIDAQNAGTKYAGGLLGCSWGNAEVFIGSDSAQANEYALTANGATVLATNATEVGGLVYAASGHWVINNKAIDLTGATFHANSANTFGLMICRGSKSAFGVESYSGLYVEDKAYWGSATEGGAYKIEDATIDTNAATFDEWVGNGVKPGSKLIDGDWNAIVSLHTEDDRLLDMSGEPGSDNSYQNRTSYGKNHQTNGSTRYYYNLDRAYTEVCKSGKNYSKSGSTWFTTPEELLLWCAVRYAPKDVKKFIVGADKELCFNGSLFIGGDSGTADSNEISLEGYSYYPTNSNSNAAVRVKNATIKFCYSDITAEQSGNKLNNAATQHENMHCALVRSMTGGILDVKNVKLQGTIGRAVNDAGSGGPASSSGIFGCRYVQGSSPDNLVTVSIDGVVLDGLAVDGAGDGEYEYAPLLINCMNTYANVTVKNVSTSASGYADGAKAASSLLGKLGGDNAELVTASFSDNISLPSLKDSSIFTHASLLESFGYKEGASGSSASYIFYRSESDKGNATYGSEIDANNQNKNEYVGKQLWYYDEDTYQKSDGLVTVDGKQANTASPVFGNYLPYVAMGKNGATYHEMKINQRIANITVGCGTYADPYALSSEFEINTIADYISNQSSAADGWEVTITRDQSNTCARRSSENPNADTEVTYKYQQSSGKWISASDPQATLANDVMHTYLQSAYYSIEPTDKDGKPADSLELNTTAFKGFGNEANPFRGVIIGNLQNASSHTKLVIKGGGTFKGLIPYSYGSVVKDLDIEYQGGTIALKYDSAKSAAAVPKTFFGGVIGCIMGGDNIIDDVNVTSSQESAVQRISSLGFNELATVATGITTDSLLIPVGGYVGAICGGGVVFRNTGASWRSGTKQGTSDLYNNPYVGRVIDGYAFSEGCDVNNGDDNYKVNKLVDKGTACVETGDIFGKYRDGNNQTAITTTVNNAQGLLVLSAIISSGAGAGACYSTWSDTDYGTFRGSNAYAGRAKATTGSYRFGNDSFGKVRNASYGYVGKVAEGGEAATADVGTANDDDMKAPGRQNSASHGPLDDFTGDETERSVNSPYLVKNYATWQTGYVCAAKAAGMDLQFKNQEYDMRSYGTGYTGLSGRYYSNACYSSLGADRDRIVPLVACINGNGAKLILQSNVKQYLNDDCFLQSWGGLFSAVTFANSHIATSIEGNGGNVVQNLQLGSDSTDADEKTSRVSLTCVKDVNGTVATLSDLEGRSSSAALDTTTKLPHMGVGAFAGLTANRDSLASSGVFSNVSIQNCSVEGPSMVGGLLGNSGWAARRTDATKNRMIAFGDNGTIASPVKLKDCGYSGLTVSGGARVGGFVGAIGSGSDSGIWATDSNVVVGQDSTISSTTQECIVGGAFGLTWSKVQVNVPQGENDTQSYSTAQMLGVTVQNNHAVASVDKNKSDNDTTRGTGGVIGNAQAGCDVRNVRIAGSNGNTKVEIGGTASESGKIVQCVGGVVGQVNNDSTYNFDGTAFENAKLEAVEGAGGLVGTIATGVHVDCSNIVVSDVESGETYSGGLVGTIKSPGAALAASNIKIQNCKFAGDACSAISGDGKGTFSLSNVLVYKNEYQATDNQGLLLGKTWSTGSNGDLKGLYVAGLDVVPEDEDGKTTSNLPDYDAAASRYTTPEAIHKVSYVALADYNDVSTNDNTAGHYAGDGSNLYNDERNADGSMPAVDSANPYVATNPVVQNPQVKASASADAKSLFSDGAASYADGDQTKLLAGKIKSEAGSPSADKYTYTNIGGIDNDDGAYQNAASYNPETADSMFNANNASDAAKKADADFPVLLISGNDTTTVESYLNVVTNGGFSDARRLNPSSKSDASHVTATTETFELQKIGEGASTTKAFVKTAGDPSLSVISDGTSGMKFQASSDWDNEQGRFTLLTVTFHEAGATYKVQVPIIVKRMLEIDFAATYSEGTNFKSADYRDKFKNHVLISSGDTMAGYLTWTYNQALGVHTEYGWNTLLASGGSMKPLNKTIDFKGSEGKGTLPSGTQLTLIDTANGNKEYHYTVGGDGATSVRLTDFYCGDDNNKTYYQEQWLSETFGAKATQNDASGIWVKTEDASAAGAKVGGEYYRVKTSADTAGPFYDLAVENEDPASENFYLIVRTPKNSARVNGYTDTSVQADVNSHINDVLRAPGQDGSVQSDGHQGTASTYSIASNYKHNLVDNISGIDPITESDNATYSLRMDVSDTISFGQQEYDDSDKLYFQLDSSLVNYKDGSVTSAQGYPTGTRGSYSFYVTVGGAYYTWSPSSQESAGSWQGAGAEETPVLGAGGRLSWTATGSDMSLVLADAQGNPIDLSGLRKIAQSNGSAFTITMKADLTMSELAGEQGIVASQDGNPHTKPSYRASLSTHSSTLSTSSNTKYEPGLHGYYRQDLGSSTIAFEASQKSQLGINIDDLSSAANGTIGAIGSYDLRKLNGASNSIAKATKVRYALSLQKRTGTNEDGSGKYGIVPIGDYLKVRSAGIGNMLGERDKKDEVDNSFIWEDDKSDGAFNTLSSDSLFQLPLEIEIDTTKDAHTYANYRLVLKAQLCAGDAVIDTPSNTSDYITYTLTRVNLSGIVQQQGSN